MLVSRCIASLQQLEQQLRHLVKLEAIRHTNKLSKPSQLNARNEFKGITAKKEKLLFRQFPVAFSLLERNLLLLDRASSKMRGSHAISPCTTTWTTSRGEATSIAGETSVISTSPAFHPPRHHTIGAVERSSLPFRGASVLSVLLALHLAEQERRRLYQRLTSRLEARRAETSPTERREVSEDLALLRHSLLARSYLSARLWRSLLLREEVWRAAVQESRGSASAASRLLRMLLTFTRVALGVLQDGANGQALNARAPRFVASLPSRRMRRRLMPSQAESHTARHEGGKELGTGSLHDEDAMLKLSVADVNIAQPPSSSSRNVMALRWLPPKSSRAVPLMLETLAMCSFVVSQLDAAGLVRDGRVHELFELLAVLQAAASTLLVLPAENETALHQTLRRLEDAMLHCGQSAKAALVTASDAALFANLSSMESARLLLALDGMRLLPRGEAKNVKLTLLLTGRIFPQLSTGTQQSLLHKARQTSLFAFATRGQRAKLLASHSGPHAVTALVQSTRVRARLQQRQMSAALRARRLEAVNDHSATQLATGLSGQSLTALLRILAAAARDAPRRADAQERLLASALLAAEGVLLASHDLSGGKRSESAALSAADHLPGLMAALSVLEPLVAERHALRRHMAAHGGDSVSRTERIVVTHLMDFVITSVNAAVARRLQLADPQMDLSMGGDDLVEAPPLSVQDLVDIVSAAAEWSGLTSHGSNAPHLASTARLFKQLLLVDVQLWRGLRKLTEERREVFIRQCSELFQVCDIMDTSVAQALSAVC